jgi:hypothetical protein
VAEDYSRFQNLTFERFQELARDPKLSRYEKIGFPDSYRAGFEPAIFADIVAKLGNLVERQKIVLDIGPGVSDLPRSMIELCAHNGHELVLIDSEEMLDQLPDFDFIRKIPARFPEECRGVIDSYEGRVDALLSYSVLHYVFAAGNVYQFMDECLRMLAPSGQLLFGDIPNIDKRKRFFASAAGAASHRRFTGTNDAPQVHFNQLEPGQIDDAVVIALVNRCRRAGFDAYVLPQAADLPMANRREDLLVVRP